MRTLLFFMIVILSSCDPESSLELNEDLFGSWKITHIDGVEQDIDCISQRYKFLQNGEFESKLTYNCEDIYSKSTWSGDDDHFIVNSTGVRYDIVSLTTNALETNHMIDGITINFKYSK